jgi:hypothetical protein
LWLVLLFVGEASGASVKIFDMVQRGFSVACKSSMRLVALSQSSIEPSVANDDEQM